MKTVYCTICGTIAIYKTSREFYGKDYGTGVWDCTTCDAYVSANKITNEPLGTFATKKLREKRKEAHVEIDVIWKSGEMTRTEVYQWIKDVMNLSEEEAHIGKFSEEQCEKIIHSAKKLKELL